MVFVFVKLVKQIIDAEAVCEGAKLVCDVLTPVAHATRLMNQMSIRIKLVKVVG